MYGHPSPPELASFKRKACLTCRFLKINCDGKRPICGPCRRSSKNDPCDYVDDRGQSMVRVLEESVPRLEARMRGSSAVLIEQDHTEETPVAHHESYHPGHRDVSTAGLRPPSPSPLQPSLVHNPPSLLADLSLGNAIESDATGNVHTSTANLNCTTMDAYNSTSSTTSSSHNNLNSYNTTYNYNFASPSLPDHESRSSLHNRAPHSSTNSGTQHPRHSGSRWPRWSITRFYHVVYHHYLPIMSYPVVWVPYYVPIPSTPGVVPPTTQDSRQGEPQVVTPLAEEGTQQ